MLSRARLWAPISRGRRRTLEMQVLKSWQAQYFVHLGLRLFARGSVWELFRGLGCCRARGCGPPSRDASAEVVAGAGSTSRTWACVCVAGAAFGSCLKGWGPHLARHSQHFGEASAEIVAGAVLRELGLRLRGRGSVWELSKGLGCCGARSCGPPSPVAGAALWRRKC